MDPKMTAVQKKICLLGDISVGKTSLINRFVYDRFDERYLSTIGVKVSRKELPLRQGRPAHLLIWDLAGNEDFSGVRLNYLQGAAGALLVCDLTRASTLESLTEYARQLRQIAPKAALIMLANKNDLVDEREITPAALAEVARQLGAPAPLLTSAKTGEGVEQSFLKLADAIYVDKAG
ncbi:MAG: GTP-binding protein [Anaerolineales bacterium]|nr:GTP-binding protein [Anaerolineales bacterium]